MVGGTGTLDEMTEIFELKRHGLHNKPLIMLNTNGFYDGLRDQYTRMEHDGFLARLRMPFDQMLTFVDTPQAAMTELAKARPELEIAVAPNLVFSNEVA
jgi:predicted Rossmann-fold nucleotide-binding protein